MIIEDVELRDIYKTASEEHLQNLEDGLLHLEKHPQDQAVLEDVLREAHTLKGDSRMLGVNDVESLIHHLEDILAACKRGENDLTPQLCDRLYQGVDAIRKLVHEAVTGQPGGVDVSSVLAQLIGSEQSSEPQPPEQLTASPTFTTEVESNVDLLFPDINTQEPDIFNVDSLLPEITTKESHPETATAAELDVDLLFPDTTAAPTFTNNQAVEPISIAPVSAESDVDLLFPATAATNNQVVEPTSVAPPALKEVTPLPSAETGATLNSNYHIDTIRVEPQKLDTLMTQAGELTVTKIRIAHRLTEIEEIVTLWEEWSRDAFVNRLVIDDARGLHNGAFKQVQNFHHRAEQRLERLGVLVNRLQNTAYEDTARLDIVANELESGIRTLRLLPLSTIFNLFPRMVRDLAKQQEKEINLIIEGGDTKADKRILEDMKDPLMHMLRNAIDHGIETPQERESLGKPRTATLRLRGYQNANSIGIELVDDGRGLNIENIKRTAIKRGVCRVEELATMSEAQIQSLIFAPGFSTRTTVTEISGRGVGLDVVRANVERLKGSIQVESQLGAGCKFRIDLNTTLATTHVLIVEVNKVSYALPVEFVQTTLLVSQQEIFAIEGCQTIALDNQPVSVAKLADLLELPGVSSSSARAAKLPCIIIKVCEERFGLIVDALLDEQDVVLKPQSKLLKRIRNVSGATILGTGEVCMILNPQDLLKSVRKRTTSVTYDAVVEAQEKQAILLVEDSITIRTQVKRILESAGYQVMAAVDGLDGFNKLKANNFDAVVSDVQMPNLDGLGLTAKIRQHKEYSELPIVLCTTLASDEDKKRGAEAGANAYLTKGTFDQKVLLDTLRRLV